MMNTVILQAFMNELTKLASGEIDLVDTKEAGMGTGMMLGSAAGALTADNPEERGRAALIGGITGGVAGGAVKGMPRVIGAAAPLAAGHLATNQVMNKMAAGVAGTAANAAKQPFLVRNAKPIGWMAAGAGVHALGQDAYSDFKTGRMIRKQNEAQQSMY